MAIFRPGNLAAAISGNLGGINFSNPASGPIIRQRIQRVNKRTTAQLARRARWAQLQNAWTSLTDQQRSSWRAWAANRSSPNRLGIHRPISGFNAFMQHNWLDRVQDGAFEEDAPVAPTLPPPTNYSFTASESGSITLTLDISPLGGSVSVICYGHRPHSSRPSTFVNSWLQFHLETIDPGPGATIALTTDWDASFGHPAQPETVALKFYLWRPDRKQTSQTTLISTTTA